jgi:aspartyl-tRNA(Asn)/glutamyl-tRNA(Gln) amidotransferase subunit A
VCALLSGPDERDATCAELPALDLEPRRTGLAGLRVALVEEALGEGVEPEVCAAVEAAAERLSRAGCELSRVSLPSLPLALPTYYVVAAAEASSNLGRYDGLRYGHPARFGAEVRRRVLLGTHVLSAGARDDWYERALRVRRRIADEFARAFEAVDLLLTPTTPGPAWPLGERTTDPLAMYAADLLTVPQNLAGLPVVSVPCGEVTRNGVSLPIGMQFTGPAFADAQVLGVAREWESLA